MNKTFKTFSSNSPLRRESQAIIDVINSQLKDLFGLDVVTGLPIFRVVWSDDETEIRYGTYDDFLPGTNIYLRTVTEARRVPKYKQWIHQKHLLERLVVVPEVNAEELPEAKISYEPLWVFQTGSEKYLPPTLQVCQFVINTVLDAQMISKMMITGDEKMGDSRRLVRYVDPIDSQEAERDNRRARIDSIVEELYGDESGLMGTTHNESSSAIIVPHSKFGEH